jgi:hypothetical protein
VKTLSVHWAKCSHLDGQLLEIDSAYPRVPGVYLAWATSMFLAFFSFNKISKLRVFNVGFSSIPTAPTSLLFDSTGLGKSARQQKAAITVECVGRYEILNGRDGASTHFH